MIPKQRLHSQLLGGNALASPHAVVSHMLAMQAQDFLGSLWAIGSRMKVAVEADIERAIDERRIVRCWPLRGTLHFTAAEDVHWLLDLLAHRVLRHHRPRLEKEFSIDARTLRKCRTLTERALRGGNALMRPELYAIWEKAGIATQASRGLHLIFALAHEKLLCFGSRRGRQQTFVLLDEWVPRPSKPHGLDELARRYLHGHGPATAADLAWWAGITPKEAATALLECGGSRPLFGRGGKTPHSKVHLLPPFDEYTVAYRDRSAIIDPAFAKKVNSGGGMLNAVLVIDGVVAGTWRRTIRGTTVDVEVMPFRALTDREQRGVDREIARYATFLGLTTTARPSPR